MVNKVKYLGINIKMQMAQNNKEIDKNSLNNSEKNLKSLNNRDSW
jgi:hypothetical protein